MPAMVNTDARVIALCGAVFAAGAALFAVGLVVDPVRRLHRRP